VADQREAAERAGKRLATMTVETDLRFSTPAAQAEFAEELTKSVAALVAKYHDETTPGGRRFRLMAGAYPMPSASRASKT